MDLVIKKSINIHQSQSLSPPTSSIFGAPSHSSTASFPILAVAIIGIFATVFLLLSYYIFVIKCCLNGHRIDLLSRFSVSRNRGNRDHVGLYSPRIQRRGLEESAIQSIPIFQFKRGEGSGVFRERSFTECAVCLNEFQEQDKLRAIPNCAHAFHVDCIDVWLQSNINCPLCRTSVSAGISQLRLDRISDPRSSSSSSPQNPNPNSDNFTGRDEDYVVIELGDAGSGDPTLLGPQERLKPGDFAAASIIARPPGKFVGKKAKKLGHGSSMGDEWIDRGERDDGFGLIQPIRRSFSMDSAGDRQMYLAVQEIILDQSRNGFSSSSRSLRRTIFSFGNGRGSRSAVLPIESEP
ncbi:RING-type E3 ubiquitin transferase [Sarracenia purpurea var. burkii]